MRGTSIVAAAVVAVVVAGVISLSVVNLAKSDATFVANNLTYRHGYVSGNSHVDRNVGIREQVKKLENQQHKALDEIQAAEEVIAQADNLISSLPYDPPNAAVVLFNQAKEHLAGAWEAFDEEEYSQAYGLANAAKHLAQNAIKKIEDAGPPENEVPPQPEEPTIITLDATNIIEDQAVLHSEFTLEDYSAVSVYFQYREVGAAEWIKTAVLTYVADGTHSDTIASLQPNTEYEFRAILEYENGTKIGATLTFGTSTSAAAEVLIDENSDTTQPTIHSVWVDPSVIAQGESTTVYVDVTDDLSGVDSVAVWWKDPSGVQVGGANIWNVTPAGVWYGTISVSEYAVVGTWTIDSGAWDEAGNSTYSYGVATFEVKGILLTTEIINAPDEVQSGETITIEVDVTSDTVSVDVSGIEVYSYIGDITSTVCMVDLAPGETKTLTLSITLDSLEPGTCTLGVVAMYENQVSEAKQSILVVSQGGG